MSYFLAFDFHFFGILRNRTSLEENEIFENLQSDITETSNHSDEGLDEKLKVQKPHLVKISDSFGGSLIRFHLHKVFLKTFTLDFFS